VARTTARAVALVALAWCLPAIAAGQEPAEGPPPMSPAMVQYLAPLLASWIASEREAAKAQGVEPIPAPIRAALEGYVPGPILERVRWRVGGGELSLPQNLIRFGHVPGVTLDDVIVFEERRAALEDPKLWAHELKHVMQFAEWGVDGFAARYLSDYEAVESEAAEFRWQFMKEAGLIPAVPSPVE
jgi:Domain of unknown function (DUF4157)